VGKVIKPYYEEENITIYNGDCLEVMKELPDKSIDLVLTDPPYNVGIKYTDMTDDNKSSQEYINWSRQWLSIFTCPKIIFVGIKNLLLWNEILPSPQWIIAWIKRNGQGNTGLCGTNKWDAILCYDVLQDKLPDIIEINNDYSDKIKSRGIHPTAKPVKLFRVLLQRFTQNNDVILDPFIGIGTTLRACKDLGRKCIGIEISKEYCDIAVKRLGQEVLNLNV